MAEEKICNSLDKVQLRNKLHNLKLHDRLFVVNEYCVMRVVGGWVYTFGLSSPAIFVPDKEQFKEK